MILQGMFCDKIAWLYGRVSPGSNASDKMMDSHERAE